MGAIRWTNEEVEYLLESWGSISIKTISKNLNRSIEAVKLKARKLGLSDARFSSDVITLNQLALALGRSYSIVKVWRQKYNLPVRYKVFCNKSRILVIDYNEFWKWADGNKDRINLAIMEPNTLGPEPEWAKVKRKADVMKSQKSARAIDWSKRDDERLAQLLNNEITYPELSTILNRTEGSIKRRIHDLGLKMRPVRLDNHIKWTVEQTKQLVEMAEAGFSYETIAQKLGKSALGVRGKLERMNFDFRKRKLPSNENILRCTGKGNGG